MAKKNNAWERWQVLTLTVLLATFAWELATWLSGDRPPYECGGDGQSYQSTCDILILVGRPFRPLARFIVHFEHLLIALGTIGLMVFTATLWWSTYRLWQETKAGGEVSKKIARTAKRQMKIQGAQADISIAQKEISRQQFLAQHRPHLRVRHVQLRVGDRVFAAGEKAEGGLVVVNAGSTKAKIIDSRWLILIGNSLPVEAPDFTNAPELLVRNETLDVGASCAVPVTNIFDKEFSASGPNALPLFVIGQIRFEDEAGVHRFMGFGRERGRDGRFFPVDNPDYEYED